ncbi:MAG: DUF998 domain-containing protein [Micropepsaceae bacterium]
MTSRWLVGAGVLLPIVYFASQLVAMAINPGFNIATQQPSELGCCGANVPNVANAGFLATGACSIVGGFGLFFGLRQIGGNLVLAMLASLGMLLFGLAMSMSGLFPLPDPLHYGFGLFPVGLLAPLFGALALRDAPVMRMLILAGFAASAALVALMLGLGGFVTESNLGYFFRGVALISFPAIALLCWTVTGRMSVNG